MNRNDNFLLALWFKTSVFWIALQPMAFVSANTLAPAIRDSAAAIDAHEQIRHRERERVLEQQMTPQTDIRLTRPTVPLPDYPASESPCFRINTIGDAASQFQWALDAADGAGRKSLTDANQMINAAWLHEGINWKQSERTSFNLAIL